MEMTRLLKPLVAELELMQKGIMMKDFAGRKVMVRACLTLVSADLPAIRKVSCLN